MLRSDWVSTGLGEKRVMEVGKLPAKRCPFESDDGRRRPEFVNLRVRGMGPFLKKLHMT
jgi:hypothetical protein